MSLNYWGFTPAVLKRKKRKTDAKFSPLWLRFCTCDVYLKKNGKGDKKSCFGPANSSTKIKSNIQTEQLSPCPLLLLISPALNSIYESTDFNELDWLHFHACLLSSVRLRSNTQRRYTTHYIRFNIWNTLVYSLLRPCGGMRLTVCSGQRHASLLFNNLYQ